ncbi:hypothetical protein HYH02_010709 [Chlamydomonas schloesseri]|uniref:Survival protein SurE-like phosphatase/nucleotidase domain-containing protein n=1 Tax=Chlamydomonas schloesseri TaxID=2026947 RepID=A0A835W6F8_9CHLO|nr:hypothetical protein HYH02_010709 [Chlamydomonas schloesseri]|eukprot:KAG2438914.1 hypothetical protein HYH02_010709 [Chlamydomonas schloesseri]
MHLQELGLRIKELVPGVEVLVVGPEAASRPTHAPHTSSGPASAPAPASTSTSTSTATASAAASGSTLHFDAPLPLRHHAGAQLPLTFSLGGGASAADCVLAAADHSAGLAAGLGLSPVLLVSGVHRGPALGADLVGASHPALALARHASLLGLPAVAACLATPTPSAPLRPAVDAAAALVAAAVSCLRRSGGWPRARNMPRSHFPFPTRGRWSLGREVPLPREVRDAAAAEAAAGGGGGAFAAADCWALGEDSGFWAGGSGGSGGGRGGAGATSGVGGAGSEREAETAAEAAVGGEARQLLRDAFAEGDVLLVLNTPPTWPGVAAGPGSSSNGRCRTGDGGGSSSSSSSSSSKAFAAARPGVLWPCYQVEPQGASAAAAVAPGDPRSSASADGGRGSSSSRSSRGSGGDGSSSSSSRGGGAAAAAVSWRVQEDDLYGRSLPRADYGAVHDRAGAFVGQDNTAVLVSSSASASSSGSTSTTAPAWRQHAANARAGLGSGSSGSSSSSSRSYSRSNWRQALEEGDSGRGSRSSGVGSDHGGGFTHEESTPRPPPPPPQPQQLHASTTQERGILDGVSRVGTTSHPSLSSLPASFVLRRGTTLTDSALAGDVEAVMARRAAVVALPAWPYGHPFSPADRLGAAALAEGRDGLPLWLVEGESTGHGAAGQDGV